MRFALWSFTAVWLATAPTTVSALPIDLLRGLLLPLDSRQRIFQASSLQDDWRERGWADPRVNGGQMLDYTTPHSGEPINIIISGKSDPKILSHWGLHYYAKSIGFSEECLGKHYGDIHDADLGDGDGRKPEELLARQHYFPVFGTCWESLIGGNHFRAWRQNGTLADSGAWFLAASKEKYLGDHHTIDYNGYNVGRDLIVQRAVAGSRYKNFWWKAKVEWVEGLLEPGSEGVNHGIDQDGRVAVLTVERIESVRSMRDFWDLIHRFTFRLQNSIRHFLYDPVMVSLGLTLSGS